MQESSANINRRRFEEILEMSKRMNIDEFIEALSKMPPAREEVVSPEYSSTAGATPQSNFRTQENVEKPQRKAPVTVVSMFVRSDTPNLHSKPETKESTKFRESVEEFSRGQGEFRRFH